MEELTLKQSISDQLRELKERYQFNYELINQLIFHYGNNRAISIIEKLKTHTKTYPIRVNTLQTTPETLLKALQEKEIPVKHHPIINECLLVDIEGPLRLKAKEKKVTLKYNNKWVNNILTGGALGAVDFIGENLEIGDEVSILDKKGEIVGNGILMMGMKDIVERKKGIAIKIIESVYKIPNLSVLKEYLRGHFINQSIPSIVVGAQVELKERVRLLDMVAGSGEILTHIWQKKAIAETRLIANEKSTTKNQKFNENIKRLRMYKAPIEKVSLDLTKFSSKFSRNETFDWIILNPPSSEIGLRPKIFEDCSEKTILHYAKEQCRYLKEAARLIKPNGTIFYITESLNPPENEEVIRYGIEELNLTPEKQDVFLGEKCNADFNGASFLQYFYPDVHDAPGQFIAKLVK